MSPESNESNVAAIPLRTVDEGPATVAPPKSLEQQLKEALDVRFDSDAGDDLTVRQWLRELLMLVWIEDESFDGRRPWGNSGWENDIYRPLVKAGFIAGAVHESGRVEVDDVNAAAAFVSDLILAAFEAPTMTTDVGVLRKALQRIERWFGEFPPTGQFWDRERTQPMSYAGAYGTNGERDYMRGVARDALAAIPVPKSMVEPKQVMSAAKRRVFIDMDGVIVDFEAYMQKWGLTGDQVKKIDGAYRAMKPMPGALEAVLSIIGMGFEVWVATKPPTGVPFAYGDKAAWVMHYLPELKRRIIVTHHKGMLGRPGDILIDDRPHKAHCDEFVGELIVFGGEVGWAQVLDRLRVIRDAEKPVEVLS